MTQNTSQTEMKDIIKKARIKKGMMQKELGELCGYKGFSTQTAVASWESGVRPVPVSKIRLVAEILDVDPRDLIP